MPLKRVATFFAWIVFATFAFAFIGERPKIFIWNITESAPVGLYHVRNDRPEIGDWAVVSATAPSTTWIADHGFLKSGWPIIKRVVAITGDEICRDGLVVTINNEHIATALKDNGGGLNLPEWTGCHILQGGDYFLLNDHPYSLDGRYFFIANTEDIQGTASLLWRKKRGE